MSDGGVERELEQLDQLADGGGPPAGWQEKVLAQVDRPAPPARSAPWPIALAGTGLVVAAVVTLLVVGLRGPEPRESTGPAAVDPRPAAADGMQDADKRLSEAVEHLLQARTEAERVQAEWMVQEATRELEIAKRLLDKARQVKWPKLHDGKIVTKCDPNDPLCGLE